MTNCLSEELVVCRKCGAEKPQSEYYKQPTNKTGYQYSCKACTSQRIRENYRQNIDHYKGYEKSRTNRSERASQQSLRDRGRYAVDPEFREVVKERVKRHRNAHPEKAIARRKLSKAIETGRIVPLKNCEHCGTTEKQIQGHHWSYEPEHWLDVIWLCTTCHGKEHRRLNELGRDPDRIYHSDLT